MYPGYMLDKNCQIRAKPETPRINLDELIALMRSKDAELWQKFKWMWEGESLYLDGAKIKCNKILL